MTQALTVQQQQIIDLTIEDVVAYLCPKATPAEALRFLRLCQAQGLNPYLGDAYLIKYKDSEPAAMVVGKETFSKRANSNPNYTGYRAGVIVAAADGTIIEREGAFFAIGETLAGGWAEVWRNDRQFPIKAAVNLSEYKTGFSNWNSKPATMIRKVALVQAWREAFPEAFSGLYDSAEMGYNEDATDASLAPEPKAQQPIDGKAQPARNLQHAAEVKVHVLDPDEEAAWAAKEAREKRERDDQNDRFALIAATTGASLESLEAIPWTAAGTTWHGLDSAGREKALDTLNRRAQAAREKREAAAAAAGVQ